MENETFTDRRDWKTYKIVKIGKQIWFADNLKFIEGTEEFSIGVKNTRLGKIVYNWETAIKACPKGWHIPSHEEWIELIKFAGGEKFKDTNLPETWHIGDKLISKSDWNYRKGTDDYGLNVLPTEGSEENEDNELARFWTSTEENEDTADSIFIADGYISIVGNKADFFAVRCIKD